MQAFHNDPEVKRRALQRMDHHIAHDNLRQGIYATWTRYGRGPQKRFRGCAVGCLARPSMLRGRPILDEDEIGTALMTEFGLPWQVTHLIDRVFEWLPSGGMDETIRTWSNRIARPGNEAQAWAREAVSLIPVGADMSDDAMNERLAGSLAIQVVGTGSFGTTFGATEAERDWWHNWLTCGLPDDHDMRARIATNARDEYLGWWVKTPERRPVQSTPARTAERALVGGAA